jgi:hypothetical protein
MQNVDLGKLGKAGLKGPQPFLMQRLLLLHNQITSIAKHSWKGNYVVTYFTSEPPTQASRPPKPTH